MTDYETLKDEVEEWEQAECLSCGMTYGQKEQWQHYCAVCFKLDRGYKLLVGDRHIVWLQQALLNDQALKEEEIETLKDTQRRLFRRVRSLKTELEETETKVAEVEAAYASLERDYERVRRILGRKMNGRTQRASAPSAEFQTKLMELVKLCHPDKHGNSEKATEMTKWLLSQR